MSVFDRLFGRGAQAAATELAGAADAAAAELTALMCVDIARARAAALLLAKLCFDRAATPGHGHGPLKAASEASAILYPAIANAMSIDAATAGRHYIELADVVRRRLESRPPAVAGAQIVAEELARAVSASQSELMLSPALIGRVDALIKSFNAILARRLGVPAPRTGGKAHGR